MEGTWQILVLFLFYDKLITLKCILDGDINGVVSSVPQGVGLPPGEQPFWTKLLE